MKEQGPQWPWSRSRPGKYTAYAYGYVAQRWSALYCPWELLHEGKPAGYYPTLKAAQAAAERAWTLSTGDQEPAP